MPNGKPGDHPLTDILAHKIQVYGQEADDLIRKIADLCSRRELEMWWEREISWSNDGHSVVRKAQIRFDECCSVQSKAVGRRSDSHTVYQR